MKNIGPKIANEKKTVQHMIRIYCRGLHHTKGELCENCQALLEYAHKRLSFCRFGEEKTTCGQCPIHCYKSDMKLEIQKVMRYAGPRMILHHPKEAIRHAVHEWKSRRKKLAKQS
ncbi:nitrous oxide-stimulated promoter family protein [Paenibacillus sp. N1-5-1-14]|uniref:nitrous oxide-stimulated promoter family protein n=1 Tax=Paenibacillus radicibacter TaxID=2972488 RepID=UPI002158EC43|nr:nitrous oxide-stimulated promoter family protein [Paenibacillus radicibacter]MCR8644212.1 nitrous oxide-stimulated promoter family protein [Paenibacillus radicibacter]